MNANPDSIAAELLGDARFRIDVSRDHRGAWTATIYDLAVRGQDVPYANMSGNSLYFLMREVQHVVHVAAAQVPS